ncbi:Pericentriolar material 1 protein [Merluccius polli]|uniref:Pericentriolar material 1 protein n=1 Tax=Merluccius polli TaxID=89951 RepID=A0AA47MXE8_MERPO|nr:Pericentriolar material 1 protein [Merluccius polli]
MGKMEQRTALFSTPCLILNRRTARPIANISGNWADLNTLTANVRACEINNRSAANLRSLNIPSAIECQYTKLKRDSDEDEDDEHGGLGQGGRGAGRGGGEASCQGPVAGVAWVVTQSLRRRVHRLQSTKQKLRQLQELVAMVQVQQDDATQPDVVLKKFLNQDVNNVKDNVQRVSFRSDDTDGTTANEDEVLHQQAQQYQRPMTGANKKPGELALSEKDREKLYEERLPSAAAAELKQLIRGAPETHDIRKDPGPDWWCP